MKRSFLSRLGMLDGVRMTLYGSNSHGFLFNRKLDSNSLRGLRSQTPSPDIPSPHISYLRNIHVRTSLWRAGRKSHLEIPFLVSHISRPDCDKWPVEGGRIAILILEFTPQPQIFLTYVPSPRAYSDECKRWDNFGVSDGNQ